MADTDETTEADDSRRTDPEILIISRMLRMLNDLDDAACVRVVAYLSSRYANVGGAER